MKGLVSLAPVERAADGASTQAVHERRWVDWNAAGPARRNVAWALPEGGVIHMA